jgi:hypothetical protein
MTDNIVPISKSGSSSPFDSIRRISEDGAEFWLARDLMPILGYARWDRVPDVIDRAKTSCGNAGNSVTEHFTELTRKTKGRPQDDFWLSRYGCYLVAMNGDPRKSEIAAAQSYFAVKTREAETVIPQMSEEMQRLAMENQNLELKLKVYEAQQRTLAAAGMLALTAPAIAEAIICPGVTIIEKVEVVEKTVVQDQRGRIVSELDGVGITAIMKEFGFKNTAQTWKWLESLGYGKNTKHWQQELTAIPAARISRDAVKELRKLAAQRKGERQTLIGEIF